MSQDSEISRILSAFRLDAHSVLNLQPGVPLSTITKTYRTLSLLIHPDKTTNPSAPDAFDRLKKAQTELSDDKARARLDECIADARFLLMREHGWTVDSEELRTEAFRREWREKTKFVLVEAEARRRRQVKGQLREEGREMVRVEAEVEGRKRKREWEQKWEESREGRVGSWREFAKKGKGGEAEKEKGRDDVVGVERKVKKKSKLKVLG